MGFEPKQDPSSLETVNEFTKRMESATKKAKSTIHKAQEDMTRYYNQRRSLAPVFKPGDWIYLDTLKGAKGTISLAQAKDAVPGPNCMLKSLWG